jgi:hypothetical protein
MKKISVVLFVLSLCALSCDIVESRALHVTNESKDEIFAFITKKEIKTMVKSDIDNGVTIKVNTENILTPGKPVWEKYIKRCKDEKLRVYIISVDSLDKYGWNDLFKKEIYIKKYYFTMDDLERINFHMTYK